MSIHVMGDAPKGGVKHAEGSEWQKRSVNPLSGIVYKEAKRKSREISFRRNHLSFNLRSLYRTLSFRSLFGSGFPLAPSEPSSLKYLWTLAISLSFESR